MLKVQFEQQQCFEHFNKIEKLYFGRRIYLINGLFY